MPTYHATSATTALCFVFPVLFFHPRTGQPRFSLFSMFSSLRAEICVFLLFVCGVHWEQRN